MCKAECAGNPVCWWLGLHFCFVNCLNKASCIRCYWCLGDVRTCIPVVSFVWVLTLWYSLGLVLWYSRSWSQCSHSKGQSLISGQEQRFHKCSVLALNDIKTNAPKQESKDEPQTNGHYEIRKIPWRKKWQTTPVFLPGISHGQRSLSGYSLWCLRIR